MVGHLVLDPRQPPDERDAIDPIQLAELELAPLTPAGRGELRRRMAAGEDVYVYQSGGPSGIWNVWATTDPGRVQLPVWEAIVAYWQARAVAGGEGGNDELVATYGLQGPPAQRNAAACLGETAARYGEYQGHAKRILLYAYHEADAYLAAQRGEHGDAQRRNEDQGEGGGGEA